ncbi:MAG: PHP domain-containing protein [Syntrophales bacterium]|nr:PHP domain-containing protein [Syntrophales bacterium]
MPAIAMTDHGNMFGAVDFYQHAYRYGIKPIIGCELFTEKELWPTCQEAQGRYDGFIHLLDEGCETVVYLTDDCRLDISEQMKV